MERFVTVVLTVIQSRNDEKEISIRRTFDIKESAFLLFSTITKEREDLVNGKEVRRKL